MAKHQIEVVNVRELARNTGRVLQGVEEGGLVLVTRNGRPVATVTPISDAALEDFVLANAREFADSWAEAEIEIAGGQTLSLSDFETELRSKAAAKKKR